MRAAVTAIVTTIIADAPYMCSHAKAKTRHTPMLTSPSASIAGSQTTRFIDLSIAKPRSDFCASPRGNALKRSHSPCGGAELNDTVAFKCDFDPGILRSPVSLRYRFGRLGVRNS
jgi:hypothetical protein